MGSLVLLAIPILFGSPRPVIHITWRDLGPGERLSLERAFQLSEPTPLSAARSAYEPLDTSTETLRAIVNHQAVEDTGGINRRALTLASSTPLSPRRGGLLADAPRWAAGVAKLFAYGLLVIAVAVLLFRISRVHLFSVEKARTSCLAFLNNPSASFAIWFVRVRSLIQRGLPAASAEAAGLFRIVFGIAVLVFLATEPANPELLRSPEAGAAEGPYGIIVHWLGANPYVAHWLESWLNISGVLFVGGLFTTLSYACFVLAFLVWSIIFTLTTSTHATAVLALTLVCLLPARWGDAWSIDALLARVLERPRRSTSEGQYGFVLWIPRLVLGLAFLAAAWSKVSGGLAWILNGTVKYHFISDLDQALVDWGPRLTESDWIAVVLSGAAVATEAVIITAAFSQSVIYAMLCGGGALFLLAGFALFQGVVWPAWWILLIAFIPWQCIGKSTRQIGGDASLSVAQLVVVGMLIVQQLIASGLHLEARPLTSAYDMYSATYGSKEEYEAASNLVYRVVMYDRGEIRDIPDCHVDDRTAALLPAAAAGVLGARERVRGLVGPCATAITSATTLALEGDRRVYNWAEGRFEIRFRVDIIGPFSVDWLRD